MQLQRLKPLKQRIVVIGDLHGCLDGFQRILRQTGLVDQQCRWQANANTHLVVCGDMVDEGAEARGIMELIRTLQAGAGERVTALLGNHELLLLRALYGDTERLNWETVWSWADTDEELQAFLVQNAVPRMTTNQIRCSFQDTYKASRDAQYPAWYTAACADVPIEVTRRGIELFRQALLDDGTLAWLQELPVAHQVAEWGFFHGGPPKGFSGSVTALNRAFHAHMLNQDWEHPMLHPYAGPESPVSTRNWAATETAVDALLAPFGLGKVAFGHSPGALNGTFGRLCQRYGKVFKADSYFSLGIEGCLDICDNSVWAIYTGVGREVYGAVHPQQPPLPEAELLWPTQ